MARKKISDNKKKAKTGITIDSELFDIFNEYIGGKNKSKYIENLIREDLNKRGFKSDKEF